MVEYDAIAVDLAAAAQTAAGRAEHRAIKVERGT